VPPPSANHVEMFRGFSYISPSVIEDVPRSRPIRPLRADLHPKIRQGPPTIEYEVLEEVLGAGTFSVCKRAIHKQTRVEYAVKIIDKTKRNPEEEIDILFRYGGHPNIMTLHEVFDDGDKAYLITEMLRGGELLDRILEQGCLQEKEAAEIMRKLGEVVEYLHSQGIVHRDLKPSNILYASPDRHVDSIRIADFGFAKQLTAENGMLMTPCYTANFVAPEVLKRQGYDKACDIWSLGVLLHTCLVGYPPFATAPSDTSDKILARITGGSIDFEQKGWNHISNEAKQLILSMLQADPAQRITASQLLRHTWLHMPHGSTGIAPRRGSPSTINQVKHAVEAAFSAMNPNPEVPSLGNIKESTLARRRGTAPNLPKLSE